MRSNLSSVSTRAKDAERKTRSLEGEIQALQDVRKRKKSFFVFYLFIYLFIYFRVCLQLSEENVKLRRRGMNYRISFREIILNCEKNRRESRLEGPPCCPV